MTKLIEYLLRLRDEVKGFRPTTRFSMSVITALATFVTLLSSAASVVATILSSGPERVQAFFLGLICVAAGGLFMSVFMFLRRRIGKLAESFMNVTSLLLAKKLNETAISVIMYVVLGWIAFGVSRGDVLMLIASVALVQLVAFAITFYRVFSGRFGYNAFEMKEIVAFLRNPGNTSIPPRIGGLRNHPADSFARKTSSANIHAPGVSS